MGTGGQGSAPGGSLCLRESLCAVLGVCCLLVSSSLAVAACSGKRQSPPRTQARPRVGLALLPSHPLALGTRVSEA